MRGRVGLAAILAVLLLAGCAAPGAAPHTWGTSYDYGTPGAVADAFSGVVYYPACGNELLTFDGRRWFPFEPSNAADLPSDPLSAASGSDAADAADVASLVVGAGPVGAVVAPGPGDDVGTLVVFENDLAYWESDSGRFSTWLTTREIEYNWAC